MLPSKDLTSVQYSLFRLSILFQKNTIRFDWGGWGALESNWGKTPTTIDRPKNNQANLLACTDLGQTETRSIPTIAAPVK
jgi:hypothetical protein